MNAEWRNVGVVARQELADTLQSRRAVVILVLYLAGAMLACHGFISALHRLETQISETLRLAPSSEPGVVLDALWKSRQFRDMVTHLIGDKAVAMQVLMMPPVALVYGWLAFTFTPLLIMFTASSRIAEEVGSGAARFTMMRTSRLSWCLGKFLGQALLLVLALMLSVIGAWSMARFRLSGFDGLATASAMMLLGAKAWLYGLAFIGLALAVSQVTMQAYLAMAVGFGVWIASSFLAIGAQYWGGDGWRRLWTLGGLLVPQGHRLDLWRTDLPHVLPAAFFLVALAFVYLGSGHLRFARRDL